MQSTSYKMEFDSINTAGNFSSSQSFLLEDTAGEIATGYGTSTNYELQAGYQQVENYYLTTNIVTPQVSLTPQLAGPGSFAAGTAEFSVITNYPGGYRAFVRNQSDTTQTLVSESGDEFTDYQPSGGAADISYTINNSLYEFGYTVDSADSSINFLSNGSVCGVGSTNTTNQCWTGFSADQYEILSRNTQNETVGGTTTTMDLRAEIGTNAVAPAGNYSGKVTIIVVPNF
jgi:hypothetical protein